MPLQWWQAWFKSESPGELRKYPGLLSKILIHYHSIKQGPDIVYFCSLISPDDSDLHSGLRMTHRERQARLRELLEQRLRAVKWAVPVGGSVGSWRRLEGSFSSPDQGP